MPFHIDRQLDYDCQKLYKDGYLFLQSIYYGLRLDQNCQKIRERHRFQYDLNAILSNLIYAWARKGTGNSPIWEKGRLS